MINVLIVDDEPAHAAVVIDICGQLDWQQHYVTTLEDAIHAARNNTFNLLVVDRVLHDGSSDGMDLISILEQQGISMAVVVISSLGATHQRVQGLDRGADAYLVKPVHPDELRAQLTSVARRLGYMGSYSTITQVGPLEIRDNVRLATWKGAQIDLTEKSYAILKFLAEQHGNTVSRTMLWDTCWPHQRRIGPQTQPIDQAITRLRRELRDCGADGLVQTQRRGGYFLSLEEV